ncbi:MAG: hypothetical protein ACK53Y_28265, partial [bacterium]
VPKILLTTRPRPSKQLFFLITDLLQLVPQSFFYKWKTYGIMDIILYANNHVLAFKAIVTNDNQTV